MKNTQNALVNAVMGMKGSDQKAMNEYDSLGDLSGACGALFGNQGGIWSSVLLTFIARLSS